MHNKIVLLDIDENMCKAWKNELCSVVGDIEIVNSDLESYVNCNNDVDGIVSPANSFGIMDGGYDAAIISCFGQALMAKVQSTIAEEYGGIQPVGSSVVIAIDEKRYLIHIPTMMYPGPIIDIRIIYQCMRTAIHVIDKLYLRKVVIPAFGRLTGGVDASIVARLMRLGYEHAIRHPQKIDWNYVYRLESQIYNV